MSTDMTVFTGNASDATTTLMTEHWGEREPRSLRTLSMLLANGGQIVHINAVLDDASSHTFITEAAAHY